MGYETRLLIGERSEIAKENELNYFIYYAAIDLCMGKCKSFSDFNKFNIDHAKINKNNNCYVYIHGVKQLADAYGQPMRVVSAVNVIKILKKNDSYWRAKWALSLLETMIEDYNNLEVLLYNH